MLEAEAEVMLQPWAASRAVTLAGRMLVDGLCGRQGTYL